MKKTFIALLAVLCLNSCTAQTNNNRKKIENLVEKLNQACANHQWEDIILYLDSLKIYDPEFDSDLTRAEALAGLGRYDEAINMLEEKQYTDQKAYYKTNTLGNIYCLKGDTIKAITQYEETIAMRPTYARPYLALGHIYYDLGLTDKAIDRLLTAVELFYQNQFLEEVVQYSSAIVNHMDSTCIDAHLYLERGLAEMGYKEDALKECNIIDNLCRGKQKYELYSWQNLFNTAENLFHLNQMDMAQRELSSYIGHHSKFPDFDDHSICQANVYLGVIHQLKGNAQESQRCLQKANEMDQQIAQQLLEQLKELGFLGKDK